MAENRRKLQSSTNDDGSNHHPIKKQKTRKVLTALTFPYDRNDSQLMIDAEDFENIQDIVKLYTFDGDQVENVVKELTTIDPYNGQYRVIKLMLEDDGDAESNWYDLPHLPMSICNMDALTDIDIYGTQIESLFPEDDEDCDHPKVIPNLRILVLESMPRLQCLPSNLGSFTKLQKLELTALPIDALPDSLSSLGGTLETLMIIACGNLAVLPYGFGQLHNLKHLETTSTPIQQLPTNFGNLKKLRYLEMNFEHLTQLPSGFKKLTNLRTLNTGRGTFHFPVPHLPNMRTLETSLSNLCRFDQALTVEVLCLKCHCKDTADVSMLDSELRRLSTWSNITRLHIEFQSEAFDCTLHDGFLSSFKRLRFLTVTCRIRNLEICIDEIACLQQLTCLDLDFCTLKSKQSLMHPAPLLNLETIWLRNVTGGLELLPVLRTPCLKEFAMRTHLSTLDEATFGDLCANWFSCSKMLHKISFSRCSIENIQPEHFQHLEATSISSIDIQDNPICRGSEDELERKLLPLVRHCQFLCDFHNVTVPASVAYHLCLNSFRRFVLGGQRICSKGLWPLIFERAKRGMRFVSSQNRRLSQAEAIFVLLKERAVTDLYGSQISADEGGHKSMAMGEEGNTKPTVNKNQEQMCGGRKSRSTGQATVQRSEKERKSCDAHVSYELEALQKMASAHVRIAEMMEHNSAVETLHKQFLMLKDMGRMDDANRCLESMEHLSASMTRNHTNPRIDNDNDNGEVEVLDEDLDDDDSM